MDDAGTLEQQQRVTARLLDLAGDGFHRGDHMGPPVDGDQLTGLNGGEGLNDPGRELLEPAHRFARAHALRPESSGSE